MSSIKFRSRAIAEHGEVPLADDGRFEDLVAHWRAREPHGAAPELEGNRCYVVSVVSRSARVRPEAQLAEMLALVRAQGDPVAGHEVQRPRLWNPRTLLGSGACEALAARALACGANLLVFDAELTPSQARNLEDATGFPVCDRESVILNVFLRHAKTHRARVQVEIAQLEYLRPRIRGLGLDMDQQTAGVGPARGPGETASELLARKLDDRIAALRRSLEKLQRSGKTQRKARASCRRIALVGYTNAGKTSLMNALTGSHLSARDLPFETLDATSRSLTRHGGDVLLSDTVGFVRRLPERLMASFESTLEEVRAASLLVWVVDASDPERRLHLETTGQVLAKLGAAQIPCLVVFNKLDRATEDLTPAELAELSGGRDFVALSAFDEDAVSALKSELIARARGGAERHEVFIPYDATKAMQLAYARCRVLGARPTEEGVAFTLECDRELHARIIRASEEAQR